MTKLEIFDYITSILREGNEDDSYIKAVYNLHCVMLEEQENEIYDIKKYFNYCISVHNKLRHKYNEDFNGPLLSWYRRFIGLYGGLK